jgi:hypothetical protein
VRFMDASGISLLVALRNQLIGTGGDLALENVPQRIMRLMQITGVSVLLASSGVTSAAPLPDDLPIPCRPLPDDRTRVSSSGCPRGAVHRVSDVR